MTISLIAAVARNRVIGRNNQLPWHLRADLRHFKTVTNGHDVVMGRRTYESVGRALPGRKTIVVSSRDDFRPTDALVAKSLDQALALASGEVFICGGAALYQEALGRADRLYLTQIDADFEGDTYFPEVDFSRWRIVAKDHNPPGGDVEFTYTFVTYERAQPFATPRT